MEKELNHIIIYQYIGFNVVTLTTKCNEYQILCLRNFIKHVLHNM